MSQLTMRIVLVFVTRRRSSPSLAAVPLPDKALLPWVGPVDEAGEQAVEAPGQCWKEF
jgi:hypothetical protein